MPRNTILITAVVALAIGRPTSSQEPFRGTKPLTIDSGAIKRSHESTVIQALAARIPNVLTHQQGGDPGASTAIRIRGPRTIVGTGQPVFIVDGIPISNAARVTGTSVLQGGASPSQVMDLSPDDIARVDVLGSAAATALYGSVVGTGGAIVITTKRGSTRTTYSLRSAVDVERPARLISLQRRFGLGVRGTPSGCTQADCFLATNFFSWGPELPAGTRTFDHANEMFGTGVRSDHALAVAGRTGRTSWRFSASGLFHGGIIAGPNDDFDRRTLRVGAVHRAGELTIGASAAYANTGGSFIERGNSANSMLLGALRTPPEFDNRQYLDPISRLHRSYRFPNPTPATITQNRGLDNPFYVINEASNTAGSDRLFARVELRWKPVARATLTYVGGIDRVDEQRTAAFPISSSGAVSGGQVEQLDASDRITDQRMSVSTPWSLSGEVSGYATVGLTTNRSSSREHDVIGRPLSGPGPLRLSNTRTMIEQPDSSRARTVDALFVQSTLDVASRATLAASLRAERNSIFRDGQENAVLPAASAAFNVTRRVAVRAAFGENIQEPPWFLQDRELEAERVRELDVGADVTLVPRTSLSVTWHSSIGRNVIVPLASTGDNVFQTPDGARIRNRGWEVMLDAERVRAHGIELDARIHWARKRNRVFGLDVPGDVDPPYSESLAGGRTGVVEGQPLGVFVGRDFARCGRGLTRFGNENVQAACAGAPDGALYIATSGFPLEDPTDRVIGDPNPRWTGGVDLRIAYMGVTASVLIEHRQGGVTQNLTRASLLQYGTHADTEMRGEKRRFGRDYFPGPVVGPGAGIAVPIGEVWFTTLGGLPGPRAQFLEDATHTRVRTVSVEYSIRHHWVERIGVRRVDAQVYARNLKLWGKYRGFDPETNLGGAAAANRGLDWFTSPLARAWGLSLSLHH